jgi:hypothetical protein
MSLKMIYDNFSAYLDDPKQISIAQKINENPERLTIYSNNVIASKIDSIRASYPAIEAIVGNEFFRTLAKKYAKQKISNSGNLDDYAHDFPQFIQENYNSHQLDYLTDLALFELNTNLIDQQKDLQAGLQLHKQNEEDLMQLQLKLANSCKIQCSNFPILSLFLFSKERLENPPNLAKDETILIYKDKFDIRFLELNQIEHNFLRNFNSQTSLYDCFLKHNSETEFQSLLQKFSFCLEAQT